MSDLYITVAVGDSYRKLAHYQRRMMDRHAWQAEHIVIEPEQGSARGRDEKCGFAAWIPREHDGRVILLDADCAIRGPQPVWESDADVQAVPLRWDGRGHHGFKDAPVPACGRVDAMCLVFASPAVARRVSVRWLAAWRKGLGKANVWSDTYALQFALQGERCQTIPGATGRRPHPSILHRYTEGGMPAKSGD